MIDKEKTAIVLCLDKNDYHRKKFYEYECMLCLDSLLLKKDSQFKDLNIFIFIDASKINCLETRVVVDYTKTYKNVKTYIYDQQFNHLFLNKIYCQYLFETLPIFRKYKYSILLDLDMYLSGRMPEQLLQQKNVFSMHHKEDYLDADETMKKRFSTYSATKDIAFNGFFIVSNKDNKLFREIYSIVEDESKRIAYEKFFKKYNFDSDYFYEECVYDYCLCSNILNTSNSIFMHETDIAASQIDHIDRAIQHMKDKDNCFVHYHLKNYIEYVELRKTILQYD